MLSTTFILYWRVDAQYDPILSASDLSIIDSAQNPITSGYSLFITQAPGIEGQNDTRYFSASWDFSEPVDVAAVQVEWPDDPPEHFFCYLEEVDEGDGNYSYYVKNIETGALAYTDAGSLVIPLALQEGATVTAPSDLVATRDAADKNLVHVEWSGVSLYGFALVNAASMDTLLIVGPNQHNALLEISRFSTFYLYVYLVVDAVGTFGAFAGVDVAASPPAIIPAPENFSVTRLVGSDGVSHYSATWTASALADEVSGYDSFDYIVNAVRTRDEFVYGANTGKTAHLEIDNALDPADEWTFAVKILIRSQLGEEFESGYSDSVVIHALLQDVKSIAVSLDDNEEFRIDWLYVYPNTAQFNTQISLEIQIEIDDSGFIEVTPTTDTSVYPHLIISDDYLYALFEDVYSDGEEHAIRVRARTANTQAVTGNEWLLSPVFHSYVPASPHKPITEWIYYQIHVYGQSEDLPVGAPRIRWPLPMPSAFAIKVDDVVTPIGEWSASTLDAVITDWLAYVPQSKKDGMQHTVQFLFLDNVNTPPVHPAIPERSTLMPNAPSSFSLIVKKIRDAFTNVQTGCEFTARLTYENSATVQLKAQVSVDSGAYVDITWSPITAYPPTIKFNDVVIPQDGLSHTVKFKLWHHDTQTNEDSTLFVSAAALAVFELAPPNVPTNVTATLIRPGDENVTDQVLVTWVSPDPVTIVVIDPTSKKRTLYTALDSESEAVVENTRRFGPEDGMAHSYRFGVAAFNRSNSSEAVYATPTLAIVSNPEAVVAQTPDEIAGTAVTLSQSGFIAALAQATTLDSALVQQVLIAAVHKIKDVVAKGGNVTLDNLGKFAANWSEEKTTYRNGQYVTVAAQRTGQFVESIGFTKGTKAGLVLSDTEAANL